MTQLIADSKAEDLVPDLALFSMCKKYLILHFQIDSIASVVSVSEFATPSAFLSMAVVEAGLKRIKKERNAGDDDDDDADRSDSDDEDEDQGEANKEVGLTALARLSRRR